MKNIISVILALLMSILSLFPGFDNGGEEPPKEIIVDNTGANSVTDYNADSPAKALADHSFMVSATDVEGVVQLIKEHKIDGVIFGYADVLMSSYVDICQQAGLPCYTTHDLNKLTLDKKYFKNRENLRGMELFSSCFPVLVVWMITGIWHGADWKYVAWGMFHAMLLIGSQVFEPFFKNTTEETDVKSSGRLVTAARTTPPICP